MTFYGYILATVYSFQSNFVSERRAYYAAAMLVNISQLLFLFAVSSKLKTLAFGNELTWVDKNMPFIVLPLIVGWSIALSYYYTLDRVEALQKKLDEKPEIQRMAWGVITILSIAVPAVLMYLW